MIISIDAEIAFDKTPHPFMIKTLPNKVSMRHASNDEGHAQQTHSSDILMLRELGSFSSKTRKRQGCPLSPLAFTWDWKSWSSEASYRDERHLNCKGRSKTVIT